MSQTKNLHPSRLRVKLGKRHKHRRFSMVDFTLAGVKGSPTVFFHPEAA